MFIGHADACHGPCACALCGFGAFRLAEMRSAAQPLQNLPAQADSSFIPTTQNTALSWETLLV
eukprot:1160479-Pelagomonas_calceolata.AAC.1